MISSTAARALSTVTRASLRCTRKLFTASIFFSAWSPSNIIVPHAVRLIWGADYRFLLPLSVLSSAVFLILADLISRTLLSPTEIPVGVVTALFGAPFFLYLLRTRKRVIF